MIGLLAVLILLTTLGLSSCGSHRPEIDTFSGDPSRYTMYTMDGFPPSPKSFRPEGCANLSATGQDNFGNVILSRLYNEDREARHARKDKLLLELACSSEEVVELRVCYQFTVASARPTKVPCPVADDLTLCCGLREAGKDLAYKHIGKTVRKLEVLHAAKLLMIYSADMGYSGSSAYFYLDSVRPGRSAIEVFDHKMGRRIFALQTTGGDVLTEVGWLEDGDHAQIVVILQDNKTVVIQIRPGEKTR